MKISYLTKCPKCGGSIDEDYSKFCPFCGNSLAENEPKSREERLKMYEYEDQAVPKKSIVIHAKNKSIVKLMGIVFFVIGLALIIMGIFVSFFIFAMAFVSGYGFGVGIDLIFEIIIFVTMFAFFAGIGLIFAIPGSILWIVNGQNKKDYKKIPDNPDEVIEGEVRRFYAEKADGRKDYNYYVYVRVENPNPMILECQYFDWSISHDLHVEQKVKIYRKGNEYIIVR